MGAVPLLTNPFVYRKVGYDPMRDFVPIAMEQFAEFMRAEHTRWGKVIREAGIKAE